MKLYSYSICLLIERFQTSFFKKHAWQSILWKNTAYIIYCVHHRNREKNRNSHHTVLIAHLFLKQCRLSLEVVFENIIQIVRPIDKIQT